MKAAAATAPGQLEIAEFDLADPAAGEVLVRLVATGICATDLAVLNGEMPLPAPIVLGHEGAGVVEAVGPGVTALVPGDHVVLSIVVSCGDCFQCHLGAQSLCEVGTQRVMGGVMPDGTHRLTRDGQPYHHLFCQSSFAEYAVVPARSAIKVRKEAPLEIAALLGCGAGTGIGAVTRRAEVGIGTSVLVIGVGGVGLSSVMAARAVGAYPIIAADVSGEKLDVARELGATHLIDSRVDDIPTVVREITGRGADVAFDAAGAPGTLEAAFAAIRAGGEAVAIGRSEKAATVTVDTLSLILQKRLTGTYAGSGRPSLDIPRAIDLFLDGRLPLDRLVSRRYALGDLGTAFTDIAEGRTTRGIVVF
jgi:Zn-dependent alcohol dehydrogenase